MKLASSFGTPVVLFYDITNIAFTLCIMFLFPRRGAERRWEEEQTQRLMFTLVQLVTGREKQNSNNQEIGLGVVQEADVHKTRPAEICEALVLVVTEREKLIQKDGHEVGLCKCNRPMYTRHDQRRHKGGGKTDGCRG